MHLFSFICQISQLLHGCCAKITSHTLHPPFPSLLINNMSRIMKSRRVEIKFARVPLCCNEECANEGDRMKFSFVEYEFLLARARGVTCDMAYSETPSFLRTLASCPSEEADSVFHVLSYSSWYSAHATFQKKNVRISWKSGKVIYAGLTRQLQHL